MFPFIAKITTQKIRIENRMMSQAQTDASSISIVGRGKNTARRGREKSEEMFAATSRKGTRSRGTAPACFSSRSLLGEGLYRRCFIIFHIEDGVKLGDLQKIVDLLREFEQLEFPALILRSSKGADEFADA